MSWFKKAISKVSETAINFDKKYCAACEKAEKAILKKVGSKHESFDSAVDTKLASAEKKVSTTTKNAAASTKSFSKKVVNQYNKNDVYRGIGVGIVSGVVTAVAGWPYGVGVLVTSALTDVGVKSIRAAKTKESKEIEVKQLPLNA